MAYTPPNIVDVISKLPHANPQWAYTRPTLAGVDILAVHYTDEWAHDGYDELAYIIGEAWYHIRKDWNPPHHVYGFGLMYHYQIGRSGTLYRTQPERLVTWNAQNANGRDIACCMHLGEGQAPNEAQLNTLQAYLDWMCYHRPEFPAGRADVWGHGELTQYGNHTSCPGMLLPYVRRYRATGKVR